MFSGSRGLDCEIFILTIVHLAGTDLGYAAGPELEGVLELIEEFGDVAASDAFDSAILPIPNLANYTETSSLRLGVISETYSLDMTVHEDAPCCHHEFSC